MTSSWLSAWFAPEFEGKALQRTGRLTREQYLQFFQFGTELFSNMEFKRALSAGYMAGQSVQELINQAQAKIFEDKVQPSVQGDFGIRSLAQALQLHGNDVHFRTAFYQFVHLEERTQDEAELPPEDFTTKYNHLDHIKSAMESQMKAREAELKELTEEERQKQLADMYKRIVDRSLAMSSNACCTTGGGGGGFGMLAQPMVPTQAPEVDELPSLVDAKLHEDKPSGGIILTGVHGGPSAARGMSEAESLAFFQSAGPRTG